MFTTSSSKSDSALPPAAGRGRRRLLVGLLLGVLGGVSIVILACFWWPLSMWRTPCLFDLPVNPSGYTVEQLPFTFIASFARGHAVYFLQEDGSVLLADDRDPIGSLKPLGKAPIPGQQVDYEKNMIFVSDRGTIFVSFHAGSSPVFRSTDQGRTWRKTLDFHVWRMDEDERTHTLYAGNYFKHLRPEGASLMASTDEGENWKRVFFDARLDHVHSVRCDGRLGRVYISCGDRHYRGQAWTGDQGLSWHWIHRGGKQGHTDLAFTNELTIWGSDDHWGRILLTPRDSTDDGRTILQGFGQQTWFVVAAGAHAYAGTYGLEDCKVPGAYLLASSDQGRTWQKLLRCGDANDKTIGLQGESRYLSREGWLFFSTTDKKAYRVRKNPD
jgi:hypothetical protein